MPLVDEVEKVQKTEQISAPYLFVASTFEIGAQSGKQIVDLIPFFVAASATPCAWLPAEQAITPFAFSSAESCEIL